MRICRERGRASSVVGMTQTENTAVSFTGAVKTYGAVRAVDRVDLEIGPGQTVALLGRNGAGKSTTIGLLLGLYEPDAGAVELFGTAPERSVRAGRVGAMLQDARPVPRVTVGELVTFLASCYPAPMPVARALELAGIADLAGRRVDRLSGGQVQRVRFALALAGDPALLVLDEPTAALGVKQSGVVLKYVAAARDEGLGVVLITHNPHHAYLVGDRFVLLRRGTMVGNYTRDEITLDELTQQMAGGSDLDALRHELRRS